jgi:hypothetical protein
MVTRLANSRTVSSLKQCKLDTPKLSPLPAIVFRAMAASRAYYRRSVWIPGGANILRKAAGNHSEDQPSDSIDALKAIARALAQAKALADYEAEQAAKQSNKNDDDPRSYLRALFIRQAARQID